MDHLKEQWIRFSQSRLYSTLALSFIKTDAFFPWKIAVSSNRPL